MPEKYEAKFAVPTDNGGLVFTLAQNGTIRVQMCDGENSCVGYLGLRELALLSGFAATVLECTAGETVGQ